MDNINNTDMPMTSEDGLNELIRFFISNDFCIDFKNDNHKFMKVNSIVYTIKSAYNDNMGIVVKIARVSLITNAVLFIICILLFIFL